MYIKYLKIEWIAYIFFAYPVLTLNFIEKGESFHASTFW